MARIAKSATPDVAAITQAVLAALSAQGAAPVATVAKPKPKAGLAKIVRAERGVIVDAKGNESPCMVFTDEHERETRIGVRKLAMVVQFATECAAFVKANQ